jgi:hypothetical protein
MKHTKYYVRFFDYIDGGWITDSSHHNFLPAKSNRINKRRKGLFAIVTHKNIVVNKEVDEKRREEPEGI